jgi:DNA-binding winged helix-turn-helix (wHTH) protein/Tfp pilus assembly protein PilF
MASRPDPDLRLAFGDFELDASASELRKRGVRVRLAGQPFEILLYLLNHSGELITREQLREHLWRDGTFVDFEGGLNAAIAKLRRALGDSAENPRYIETVPGRGYRFIGSLREVPASAAPERVSPPTNLFVLATAPPTRQQPAEVPKPNRHWRVAIAACLAALAIVGGAFFYFRRRPVLAGKRDIVLAAFVNRTGEPVFDETLRQGLAIQLQESPFLNIISEERIQHTLMLMGQAAGVRLTPELAREVCVRTASAAFVEGSIAPLGNQYVLGLTAKTCAGDTLDDEQVQAATKEQVLNAVTQIARKFRARAGESLATIREHETPLAEATTPSLEALKAYSAARKVAFTTGFTAAVPLLERAIDLDPQFATAHAFLGRIYADIGESVLSIESTKRAYALRDRASDPERFFITFSYYRQITGDLAKAQQTLELWAQTYPRDNAPHSLLSGATTSATAQYERTMDEAEKAIALNPDATPAYLNLADGSLALGRIAEAENALRRAAERKLEIADSCQLRYSIAFLRNDRLGMDRELARAKDEPGAEDWILRWEALVSAYSGRLQRARELSQRAVDMALRAGQPERAAI